MAKRENVAAVDGNMRWLVYGLIAVAAFGAGIVSDRIVTPENVVAPLTSSASSSNAQVRQQALTSASPTGGFPRASSTSAMASAAADDAVDRGNESYDNKNWAGAITQYERAISLGRDTPDVRTDLGNAYRFSGNAQKALEEYRIAQQQNANHEQSLFNQGSLYADDLGDLATGVARLREFVARFPSSPRVADARRMLADYEARLGPSPAGSPAKP